MGTPVIMPQLGESVTEGTLVKWFKKKGEKIKRDEILYEVSTDKVDSEIPSPASGTLSVIKVGEGEKVPAKTEVAVIEEEAAERVPAPAAEEKIEPKRREEKPPKAAARRKEEGPVSPIVRKLAREKNIDLSTVKGTGTGGRITKDDLLKATEKAEKKPLLYAVAEAKPAAGEIIETMPVVRRQISEHMMASLKNSAQVTNVVEVDMSAVSKFRNKNKQAFMEREGFSLSYLAIFAKAAILALKEYPELNATVLDNERIVKKTYVNLGIAVSLGREGLIVPVIKRADEKTVTGLARSINDLANRTRSKKLSPDDVQGGTFTITNQGTYGSVLSTPIINYPQTSILSLETIMKKPVVVDDAIAIRPMVYMPLTWDHRVIDGAIAGMYLSKVKEILESWDYEAAID